MSASHEDPLPPHRAAGDRGSDPDAARGDAASDGEGLAALDRAVRHIHESRAALTAAEDDLGYAIQLLAQRVADDTVLGVDLGSLATFTFVEFLKGQAKRREHGLLRDGEDG